MPIKTINLIGGVGWEITNRDLVAQLPKNNAEPVRIFVDSYGGDAFEGFAIFNTLDKRKNVTVEIGARAFSAASYFPFAADTVIVNKNSTWMAHNAASLVYGDKNDMKKEIQVLEGIDNIIAETYVNKLGMDKKQVLAKMSEEFWLFGGQNILDMGIANEMRDGSEEELPEKAAVVQNFRAIFNEKMSHKPNTPKDSQLMNFIIEDFEKRKDEKQVPKSKTDKTETAPVETPAETPVVPTEPQNIVTEPVVTPVVPVVTPAVDNAALISNAVNEEQTRIMELLALSGVKLADPISNAIKTKQNARDYAYEQLKANMATAPVPTASDVVVPGAKDINKAVDNLTEADNETSTSAAEKRGNAVYELLKKK